VKALISWPELSKKHLQILLSSATTPEVFALALRRLDALDDASTISILREELRQLTDDRYYDMFVSTVRYAKERHMDLSASYPSILYHDLWDAPRILTALVSQGEFTPSAADIVRGFYYFKGAENVYSRHLSHVYDLLRAFVTTPRCGVDFAYHHIRALLLGLSKMGSDSSGIAAHFFDACLRHPSIAQQDEASLNALFYEVSSARIGHLGGPSDTDPFLTLLRQHRDSRFPPISL